MMIRVNLNTVPDNITNTLEEQGVIVKVVGVSTIDEGIEKTSINRLSPGYYRLEISRGKWKSSSVEFLKPEFADHCIFGLSG